jgi:hypothetical protein
MSPPYQPALFESSLPKWLACTDELAAGISTTHARRPSNVPTSAPPLGAGLGHGVGVDRPGSRYSVEDALRVPSAQLGHPEPRNGHAHLGYVLASPVSGH